MIGLVVHAVVLIVIMWLVARHSAELNFFTALLVTVGVGICSALLGAMHPFLGLVGFIAILPLGLVRFCSLTLKHASIVTGLFTVWLILYQFFMGELLN
jgi:hypothetical protein